MPTQEDDRERPPVPRFLTPRGRQAHDEAIDGYRHELNSELERRAAADRAAGRQPEQTAEDVRHAVVDLQNRMRPPPSNNRDTWSYILLTFVTTGLTITAILLPNSLLKVIICLSLGVVAVLGLVLKWLSRPGRRSSDPR